MMLTCLGMFATVHHRLVVVVVAIPWHFHYIHCHLPLKERALPFGF